MADDRGAAELVVWLRGVVGRYRERPDPGDLVGPLVEGAAQRLAVLASQQPDPRVFAQANYELGWWHHLRADVPGPDRDEELRAAVRHLLLARTVYGDAMPDAALPAGVVTCLRGGDVDRTSATWRAWLAGRDDVLTMMAQVRGRLEDQAELVQVRRERYALTQQPGLHATADDLHGARLGLATALREHGRAIGDAALMAEAIALLRACVRDASDDRARGAGCNNLANALRELHELVPDVTALTEAWSLAEEAEVLLRDEAGWAAGSTVAYTGLALFKAEGRREVLDRALATTTAAYATVPADAPGWQRALLAVNLSHLLSWSFTVTGRRADLDRAVELASDAVRSASGQVYRATAAAALAVNLLTRYRAFDDPADLAAAIVHGRSAVDETAEADSGRPAAMGNLAHMYTARARRTGAVEDHDTAVALAEDSLALFGPSSPDLPRAMEIAATCVGARGVATSSAADLLRAADLAERAADATDPRDPERPRRHGNAQYLLAVLIREHGRSDLVERRLAHARAAVDTSPLLAAERASALVDLGAALLGRADVDSDPAAVEAAREVFLRAAHEDAGDGKVRYDAAVRAGQCAERLEDVPGTFRAYALATDLLAELAWRGVPYEARVTALAGHTWVTAAAAESALLCGRPEDALTVLERGRRQLWSQEQELDEEIGDLAGVDPVLAAEVRAARADLAALERAPVEPSGGVGLVGDARGAARRNALARWEEVRDRVREVEGHDRFLVPPTVDDVRRQLAGRLVAYVFPGGRAGRALLVGAEGLRVVELPGATMDRATALAEACLDAAARLGSGPEGLPEANTRMAGVLDQCWDAVTGPVLEALGWGSAAGVARAERRIWWCPTGPLTLLPLHAAAPTAAPTDGALDRCVSSYTGSARALARAVAGAEVAARDAGVTLVGIAAPPGAEPLPFVHDELDAVAHRARITTRVDDGTRAQVLDAVARAEALHVACHGRADRGSSPAAILTVDGPLELPALRGVRPAAASWAYISACGTAAVSPGLADEQLTLAAGFQSVGYPHVVGTLWSISDQVAALVADLVYRLVCRDGGRLDPSSSAVAVNAATRKLREWEPDAAALWGAYVHLGP